MLSSWFSRRWTFSPALKDVRDLLFLREGVKAFHACVAVLEKEDLPIFVLKMGGTKSLFALPRVLCLWESLTLLR